MEEKELKEWRKGKHNFYLYFDGASKGNLGEERGGGLLLDTDEKEEIKYAWGLGLSTNNEVEYLSLYQ